MSQTQIWPPAGYVCTEEVRSRTFVKQPGPPPAIAGAKNGSEPVTAVDRATLRASGVPVRSWPVGMYTEPKVSIPSPSQSPATCTQFGLADLAST